MNAIAHPFQQWIDKNGIQDVVFYPNNPSESSATSLLDDAMNAVHSYENKKCIAYVDNTPETPISDL